MREMKHNGSIKKQLYITSERSISMFDFALFLWEMLAQILAIIFGLKPLSLIASIILHIYRWWKSRRPPKDE